MSTMEEKFPIYRLKSTKSNLAGGLAAKFRKVLTVPGGVLQLSDREGRWRQLRFMLPDCAHIQHFNERKHGGARRGGSLSRHLFPVQLDVVGWVFSISLNTETSIQSCSLH